MEVIEYPIFLNNSELISPNDGTLYHYTKFDSFMKIIENMTLRSSPLYKMNDLNEANLNNLDWDVDFLKMVEAEQYVKKKCSLISFTKTYRTGTVCQLGSNHPSMWAHYADDSNGVCLALDKKLLLELNRKTLKGIFHKTEKVSYRYLCSPDDSVMQNMGSNVSEFVQRNYKELFFVKHMDWKSEHEIRFFAECPELFLNIKGAIKYIVLGERLSKDRDRLTKVIEQIIVPNTQSFHYLIPHSFAEMRPSPYGYFIGQADYLIEAMIEEFSGYSNNYLKWRKETFA